MNLELKGNLIPLDFIIATFILCIILLTVGFLIWLNYPIDYSIQKQCLSVCNKMIVNNTTDNIYLVGCVWRCT